MESHWVLVGQHGSPSAPQLGGGVTAQLPSG